MSYYELDDESGICPVCGNHFGYGIVIDGMCEDCYTNQQKLHEQDYPEPPYFDYPDEE